jgi:hypothetical protein
MELATFIPVSDFCVKTLHSFARFLTNYQ